MNPLERAILETLAYSDIFEYPLRADEVHRYLPLRANLDEVQNGLNRAPHVDSKNGFYFLAGRAHLIDLRLQRADASLRPYNWSHRLGRILSLIPFVRMVGLTGSLAMLNLSKSADMDFMLVTAPNRLWTARAFAVTFGRLMRLFGHRICVNLLVSENALLWPQHDLYSAREMCQMIPVAGLNVYHRLRDVNQWTDRFLPNAAQTCEVFKTSQVFNPIELLLRGKLGDKLEAWCLNFQLRHILRQGLSDETNFTADVCQGNFHSHRKWTHEAFQEKLSELEEVTVTFKVTVT